MPADDCAAFETLHKRLKRKEEGEKKKKIPDTFNSLTLKVSPMFWATLTDFQPCLEREQSGEMIAEDRYFLLTLGTA